MLDIQKIRADFPILSQQVNGKPLVYFDNGATSQKPLVVINAISKYYKEINANIHRGVHTLSQLATDAYEESRGKIQKHINAKNTFLDFRLIISHILISITIYFNWFLLF